MNVWGSVFVAVITAIATTGLAEVARILRDRAADRKRAANWGIKMLPVVQGVQGRLVTITNIGDADALDVRFEITGSAKFEVHPDARLDHVRPGDVFMVHVQQIGTGVFRFVWNNSRGQTVGPVDRFPPT